MKTTILTMAFCLGSSLIFAQTHLYEHPQFDQIISTHETVAILPFQTSITLRPKEMKDMSTEQLEKMEESEGLSIQSAMHSWFLKREKTKTLKISFLDPTTTNAKLKRAGVTSETFEEYTPDEFADILGVDAIIMGTFETNKPMSEGASLALGLLGGIYGSTNKALLNLSIFNSGDGVLLANYNKAINGSLGSSTEDLINTLMRKASRRISYTE